MLIRQQFHPGVREGLYTRDFALSGSAVMSIVKTRRPDLPVFMISAYGDAVTVTKALARGADGFFTKPVEFPKLKQDIMAVMTDATGATDDRTTNRRDN
jgi:DNA-binding NtrC family response regulator